MHVLTLYMTVCMCDYSLWLNVLPVWVCSIYMLYACVIESDMSLCVVKVVKVLSRATLPERAQPTSANNNMKGNITW